jgi:cell division transport system permease protein
MLDRIQFLIGEGFLALRRNGWMTFAAISTVAVALFLIGGLFYVHTLLKTFAGEMTGVVDIRAFVQEGASPAERSRIAQDIRKIPGVKSAVLIPGDKYWEKFLKENPKHREYAEIDNPYPDSFKIALTDLKLADGVVSEVKRVKGVSSNEVKYLADVANLLAQGQAVVSWLGVAVGGLLFVTAGVLIYNAIRLTVISRRLEIRIMQLVGASFLTVRVPFYIEGVVQGLLGGTISVFIIFAAQTVLSWRMRDFFRFDELTFPWLQFFLALPLLGALYGLLCSMIAVRTPLRYR